MWGYDSYYNTHSLFEKLTEFYHIFLSSWTGSLDFSKNNRAIDPASNPVGSGCNDLN